jgi:hypothetical protein
MPKIHPLSTKNQTNIISLSFPGKNIPDFSKTLSRDQLIKIEQRNVIDVPYRSPDITKIKDRSVMMVQYDKTNYYNKQPTYKPEAPIDYNVDKVYNKINNNKQPSTPNFSLMISRPEYGVDPLPSFMKKIYTRASSFTTTDKTLMMNSFAMSEYLGHYSSFFPKRSYNKNINLALLNSDKVDIGLIENKSEFNKLANFVTKTTFYNKKDMNIETERIDLIQRIFSLHKDVEMTSISKYKGCYIYYLNSCERNLVMLFGDNMSIAQVMKNIENAKNTTFDSIYMI